MVDARLLCGAGFRAGALFLVWTPAMGLEIDQIAGEDRQQWLGKFSWDRKGNHFDAILGFFQDVRCVHCFHGSTDYVCSG